MDKYRILMCGSDFSVGGGMVAVTRNYLEYNGWEDIEFIYVPTHIEGNALKKSLIFMKGYMRVFFLILRRKVDLAHLHTTEKGSFFRKGLLLRLLKRWNVPTIMHHHINYQIFYEKCGEIRQKFIRDTFSMADRNIMLGDCYCRWVLGKTLGAKVCTVYNAVQPYKEKLYNMDGHLIMFLGWLIERKGIYEFLRAIRNLDGRLDKKYRVVLCGHGNEAVERFIDDLDIRHRIEHIGWVDSETKNRYLAETVINVLPSRREGLPMTVLETMAYGIPNIVTDISIMSELIAGEDVGTVIEMRNEAQLAEAIFRVINDRDLRLKQSENSYRLIEEKFNIEAHLNKMEQIYRELLAV